MLTLAYDSQGNFVSATDRYNRSVYYATQRYNNQNIPEGGPPISDELTRVSVIVPTGTINPLVRNQYGYENHGNTEAIEQVPYLHSVSVISPTGSGMSTGALDYDSNGFLQSITDANGNKRVYTYVSGGMRVDVKNPAGAVEYSYTDEYDGDMNITARKDASGHTVASYSYSDADTPYSPTTVTDGNGLTTTMDWDSFNNLLSVETPKSITTTYSRSYVSFPFGELTAVQEGTKTSTTFEYYEPSGLLHYVHAPIPGQVGTGNRQTTTYTYNSYGDILTIDSPGNNATSTRSVSFNYTADGLYSQPQSVGQPIVYTNELGKKTHFRYDSRGNLNSTWDALGNTTTASFNLADQPTDIYLPSTGNTGTGHARQNTSYLYTGGPPTGLPPFLKTFQNESLAYDDMVADGGR